MTRSRNRVSQNGKFYEHNLYLATCGLQPSARAGRIDAASDVCFRLCELTERHGGSGRWGLFGGLMGAIVGGAVGGPRGALVGAGVGAAAGGTAGGLNGAAEDKREQRAVADVQAAYARGQQQLQEVAQMAMAGNSDAIIIGQIRNSGALFNLSNEQITYLHTNHVSDNVIAYMQSLGQPGYGGPPPGVVVIQRPPPVVAVGVGYYR